MTTETMDSYIIFNYKIECQFQLTGCEDRQVNAANILTKVTQIKTNYMFTFNHANKLFENVAKISIHKKIFTMKYCLDFILLVLNLSHDYSPVMSVSYSILLYDVSSDN
jgi:hypothetical protein